MNPESLETFLHHLHFETDKAKPPDWEVDWGDAPLPYKLYRGLPTVPLSPEVPLSLGEMGEAGRPAPPNLRDFCHFLWYVFGLTQVSQIFYAADSLEGAETPVPICRRFVPSGGALYPNELYAYLKLADLPYGVYHYDAAHHRLALLREGGFDSYLARALGDRCDVSACFAVVFVSAMFWKNFFKYHNFSYRLQGLDAGVLLGQLLEVAKRFRYASAVYFQFLDRAVNHLLGLSEREESVYAVIPLSVGPAADWFFSGNGGDGEFFAADLCRELPEVRHGTYMRSQRIREYPMLIRMNEASMLERTGSFRRIGAQQNSRPGEEAVETVALPRLTRLSCDLASACRKRVSPGLDFVFGKVDRRQLAALLQEAASSFPYLNDLGGPGEESGPRVSLYLCLYGVEGVPDGAYYYDHASHRLRQIRPGDHRLLLQRGMSLQNVNLFQVPLCLHVAGDRGHLLPAMGYRGYRIQQMEAGMLLQRLLLAASALGMGGHPLLDYDASRCDELYQLLQRGKTILLQIPAGPCRSGLRLEGGLHA